jgi:TolB-like protein
MSIKKIIFYMIAAAVAAAHAADKPVIAILDFDSKGVSMLESIQVSDFLRNELVMIGSFTVVDRNNMQLILKEQKFQLSGCTEQECAVEMGKLLSARMMVIGSVIRLGTAYFVNANIVDVETGKITVSEQIKGYSIEELLGRAKDIARWLSGIKPSLLEQLPYKTRDNIEKVSETFIEAYTDFYTPSAAPSVPPDNIAQQRQFTHQSGDYYVTELSRTRKVMINLGDRDGLRKYDCFYVYRKDKQINKICVIKLGNRESKAQMIDLSGSQKAAVDDTIVYYAHRKETGYGLIFSNGYAGVTYDYISVSGLGLQYNLSAAVSPTVLHYAPVIVKYHFFPDKWISPYLGAGICGVIQRVEGVEQKHVVGLVFNAGIDLFTLSAIHLTFDARYFIGDTAPDSITNRFVPCLGLTLNW